MVECKPFYPSATTPTATMPLRFSQKTAPGVTFSEVRIHPNTRNPISVPVFGAGLRSFWQASAMAQKRSACPRPVRLASKLTLPDGNTRRLMEWIWPTSSRSRGSAMSLHWKRVLRSVAHRSLRSLVNASGATCG